MNVTSRALIISLILHLCIIHKCTQFIVLNIRVKEQLQVAMKSKMIIMLTTELLATQSIKHIKAFMHVWILTQEINSDISKWNVCEKVATSRHLTTFTERSSVVSLQVINMWKYIQSTFVLVPLIQGIQIGFYVWTLIWCIYLIARSPCCINRPLFLLCEIGN
jgi:hypothetical protein